MAAKFILIGVAAISFAAAVWRRGRVGHFDSASKTWLFVTAVFAVVSAFLWWSQTTS